MVLNTELNSQNKIAALNLKTVPVVQYYLDKMIVENFQSKKNLSMAWIDYRKAFDCVPHNWLLKTLEIYKTSPVVSKFLHGRRAKWNTRLVLHRSNGMSQSNNINIKTSLPPR
ncbi:uncharacterized protein LOC106879141 [Octopus bimaculoides]|uniref:uncharacterized protein LOC106879141 n=1 Tax=Octopus bimaculoides TaxID=37653 RepID=UPI00071D803D|nr:uncharacterized protein LOC106879141 [Octopus bimaculoides]|eukprot:XP_014784067.1 PREDICTED: uncharacterized protein LOC106879141 [Octopus bimaculoides]